MVVVALAAFGFTFSLVPLYRIACEKVFGIRLERTAAEGVAAAKPAASERVITVQFDGGVNSKLPWEFAPNQLTMQVRPGEQYETTYYARNTSDARHRRQRRAVGRAGARVGLLQQDRVLLLHRADAAGRRGARHAGAFHRRSRTCRPT